MAKDWAKAFYKSKEWQGVREYVLMRDKYLCVMCGAPAEEVHHIKHLTAENIYDPNISLNASNLQSLCRECHQKEHKRDRANGHRKDNNTELGKLRRELDSGFVFDANGQLVPRE